MLNENILDDVQALYRVKSIAKRTAELEVINLTPQELNEKIEAKDEAPISKSTDYMNEESNEEDVVQKSATAETVAKGEKAEGVVSKSVEGDSAVEDAPQAQVTEEQAQDNKAEEDAKLRSAFMKQFTERASKSPRNNEIEIARQDYINWQNGVATEDQVQNIKRFAGLE